MPGKPKKAPREKNLTSRYLSGGLDEDRVERSEQFKPRHKTQQGDKILRTALMRAEEESGADIETLPIGQVVQVFSLFCQVEHEGTIYLCVIRRTLIKHTETFLVVGDLVRFRDVTTRDEAGTSVGDPTAPPAGVVELILPRKTILTRSDSFKAQNQRPIVANADQMLIVASIRLPRVKWGLVDRMIIAAESGGLKPIVCLNKIDLADPEPGAEKSEQPEDIHFAAEVMAHYETLGVRLLRTSVIKQIGLDALRDVLGGGKTTVLSGHSGVGKSSLIRAIEPQLDIRIGEISRYNDKGRHTTTSTRRYVLGAGGQVIDTPGVKQFGLWGVTRENLPNFFPDVAAGTAPTWRQESFERIAESLSAV